jgi:hypothetical protein
MFDHSAFPPLSSVLQKTKTIYLIGAIAILHPNAVRADVQIVKSGDVEVRVQAGGGVYYEQQNDPGFGSGVEDQQTHIRRPAAENDSIETFVYGGVSLKADTSAGKFFAAVNELSTFTGLDGDASGIGLRGTKRVALEEAYLGWSSGDLIRGLPKDAITVSVGAQTFQLNDGFVIWDGNDDGPNDGASSLVPRAAFPMAAVAQFDGSFFHMDAFWLKADKDQSSSKLYGGQLSAIWPNVAEFGATYFKIYESDNSRGTLREGMNVFNFYGKVHTHTSFVTAKLQAGYTAEVGSVRIENQPVPRLEYDAEAYYFMADATLTAVPGNPALRYRFANYSGDDPSTILTVEEYDPLFIDPIEYGSVGFFNGSNAQRHEFRFSVKATDRLSLSANFVASKLNRPVFREQQLASRSFSKLFSLGAEYELYKNTKLFMNVGIEKPGPAAKEYFGNDKNVLSTAALLLVDW